MKSDFLNLAVDAAVDESGTAYSQEFLRAHLPRISRDAAKLDVPVSLIGLKLTSQSVDHVTSEAIGAAYSKTADLLNNLVRMQDVVCRWDKDKFILAFYDTNQTEAEIILTRVRALLDCAVYQTGSSERGALGVSAQSVIVPLKTNPLASENQLDALIANLVNDPDET